MNLRSIYYWFSPQMRMILRKIYFLPIDMLETLSGSREKYEPLKGDIYIGSGDFINQGLRQLDLLKKHISLGANESVLDIGSGIGRTAVPLTKFLSKDAEYEGFDVVEKGVKWCNDKINKDFPNFNFIYAPLNNDLYNSNKSDANKFQFPYKGQQFDKAFLFSVFTHMQIPEIENYLKEINRVLKPGGLCLATLFFMIIL